MTFGVKFGYNMPVTLTVLMFLIDMRSKRASLLAVFLPLLTINIWCGIRTFKLTAEREIIKDDYAHINSIGNGLLSVNAWKAHLQNIVGERIMQVTFTPAEEKMLKFEIEKLIQAVVAEADSMMKKPQKTLKGKIRKVAYK